MYFLGLLKIFGVAGAGFMFNLEEKIDEIKMYFGDSLPMAFASLLRSMIMPSKGHRLFVADFSKVEVAVCWWLCKNKPGLDLLTSGRDPYKDMASDNTGKDYEDIADEGDDRQLGKGQILGCQFGMGPGKFKKTAWDLYRLKLTEKQSREAVANYREKFPACPSCLEIL